jgi:dTDP-4-amino-4,6-dideoxygalactose transaminase
MTTGGEGGMVTTDDRDLWARMWSLKDHGKSWEAVYERPHPPGFRWLHEGFGTNWRLTGMQAASGRIQLRRMDVWHARRLGNAEAIWRACRVLPGLRVPVIPPEVGHAAYPYNGTYEHAYHML